MNAISYGWIIDGTGATTAATKKAISDPAYHIPAVSITPYQKIHLQI